MSNQITKTELRKLVKTGAEIKVARGHVTIVCVTRDDGTFYVDFTTHKISARRKAMCENIMLSNKVEGYEDAPRNQYYTTMSEFLTWVQKQS